MIIKVLPTSFRPDCRNQTPANKTSLRNDIFIKQPKTIFNIAFGSVNFDLKSIKGLPCPCCGRIMTTNEELIDFQNKSRTLTGKALAKELGKFDDRLPDVQNTVLSCLNLRQTKILI
jgi:hypothetical protein